MPEQQMPERTPQPRHDPELARALGCVGKAAARLPRPRRVCVAVSGGPDSVAMLGLLHRLAHREELDLAVAHVDHGLRESSRAEAELVRTLAESLSLPFAERRLGLEAGAGLPARARGARHAALRDMAKAAGCTTVALGHTATDQAETMLMHLTRGAGLDGLAAMPELEGDRWRPVLELTRRETRELCELMGLAFVDDPTNECLDHFRVELRREVLPRMRAQNPRLEEAMLALSRRARDAELLIMGLAEAEFAARRQWHAGGQTHSLSGYAELEREVRTRWLRRVIELDAGKNLDGGRRIIEDIDRALCADAHAGRGVSPRRWSLGGGQEVWVERGRLGIGASGSPKP